MYFDIFSDLACVAASMSGARAGSSRTPRCLLLYAALCIVLGSRAVTGARTGECLRRQLSTLDYALYNVSRHHGGDFFTVTGEPLKQVGENKTKYCERYISVFCESIKKLNDKMVINNLWILNLSSVVFMFNCRKTIFFLFLM